MPNDLVILGDNCVYSTDCEKTGLNNNIIVCGGSGSGKTMSYTEARLLTAKQSSMIIPVTKRRIVSKYTPLHSERGYRVLDLNFSNPALSSCGFDPLKYIRSYSDITFLATSIVKANTKKETSNQEPFWDDAAISLLSAEIAYTLMTLDNPTFADVLNLHFSMNITGESGTVSTSIDEKFDLIAYRSPDNFALSCWKTFKNLPSRTAGCVYSTLNTTLDTVFTPEIRKMIATGESVNFKQLAREKTVLYVTTSAVNPSLNHLVSIFYSLAFKELYNYGESMPDGRLPIPVHILCDDFATGSKIVSFPEYISVIREKNMSVSLLIQSESQLEQMYGQHNAVTIIDNCDSYLYLGGMNLKTAENISRRANIPLDEVLYMPIGREFIFRRGQRPIVTQRYSILQNELYRKITEQHNRQLEAQMI